MTIARSAADVLAGHVTLEVECLDRMYLNVYQPRLQHVGGVVSFLRNHRGYPFASSALLEPISGGFVGGLYRLAKDQGVAVIDFVKGQRKDDVAQEFLAEFDEAGGSVVRRAGPGEDGGVPHREASQPDHGGELSVDRADHGDGEPLLHLCR